MSRITINMSEAILSAYRGMAEQQNRPIAELLRRALSEWLEAGRVERESEDD